MKFELTYKQFNERSILIVWPNVIDDNVLKDILVFKDKINRKHVKSLIELISSYNSLLVVYDFTIDNINTMFFDLKSLYLQPLNRHKSTNNIWEIPVCYDPIFGVDLEAVSIQLKLSKQEIVRRHTEQIYTVFFIGFLPGFLYLGGLHKSLKCARKSTPSLEVKKGAVAIGENQTGIYPKSSPGGWHVIGNSPLNFFDIENENPCFAKAGDKVKFCSISYQEYLQVLEQVKTKNYQLKSYFFHD